MKILVTLLTPTKGEVKINGLKLEKKNYEAIKKRIGYLPQELGLYPNMTVRESLEYVGIMCGMGKKTYTRQIDFYLKRTGLLEHQHKKNKQLSGGMKRRVGLVQALPGWIRRSVFVTCWLILRQIRLCCFLLM